MAEQMFSVYGISSEKLVKILITNSLTKILKKYNEFVYIFLFFGVNNLYFNNILLCCYTSFRKEASDIVLLLLLQVNRKKKQEHVIRCCCWLTIHNVYIQQLTTYMRYIFCSIRRVRVATTVRIQ